MTVQLVLPALLGLIRLLLLLLLLAPPPPPPAAAAAAAPVGVTDRAAVRQVPPEFEFGTAAAAVGP
jgi:hypothetical protein